MRSAGSPDVGQTERGALAIETPTLAGRPVRFFYGWVIVAVMATTGALTMAMGALNFGLFIKPMGDELGVGRSVFGWCQTGRLFAGALSAPVVGSAIDRFGVRLLLSFAALLTAGAMVGLSFVGEGWQIVLLYGLMGVVGMSGPGALVTTVPVTQWFVRERGRAMAFASLGTPIGGLLFVPLTQILIDAFGWRATWIILATLGLGVIVPLTLLFMRRRPEDLGLLPDGGPPTTEAGAHGRPGAQAQQDEYSWTRAEAFRTSTFWKLILVFSLVMLSISSVGVHRIPSFMDRGLDPRLVSYATGLDAGAAGLSMFVMGLLTRHWPARYIGAGGFLLLALASLLTIAADSHPVMFVSMISYGLGIGVNLLMQNFIWAQYFGRRHQGAIRGAVTPITLLCGGIGPPIAGYVRDLNGSYDQVWLVAVGLMVLGALVLATTPPPRLPVRPSLDLAAEVGPSSP